METNKKLVLRQTLKEPIDCPFSWDGGKKQVFQWSINGNHGYDSKGYFVRIDSWTANHWFHVAEGRTVKLTLRNAMFHLRGTEIGRQSKFEYVEI